VRTTCGTDSGLWATLRASDGEKGGPNMRFGAGGTPLPAQAAQASTWPTVHTHASTGAGTQGRKGGMNIQTAVALSNWPTPTTRDHKDGHPNPNVPVNGLLGRMVWPTPNARDHFPAHTAEYIAEKKAQGHGMSMLNDAAFHAATWQTMVADDALDREQGKFNSRGEPKLSAQAIQASNGSSAPTAKRGALNPEFVCWLMGFPQEWVCCGVSAMQSTQDRRRRSSPRRKKRSEMPPEDFMFT
jgi:hypothetical protein